MKKLFLITLLAFAALTLPAKNILSNDGARQAIYGAVNQAVEPLKLGKSKFGNKSVAVYIKDKKYSFLTDYLKKILLDAELKSVTGKDEEMWLKIIKEIEAHKRMDDILDPATKAKFGKLQATLIILRCEVRVFDFDKENGRYYTEVLLIATEVETGRDLWSGLFTNRYYLGKDVEGIVALDDDLRAILKKNFDNAQKSLTAPQIISKMKNIQTVTVIPLGGDIGNYITSLAKAMITKTHLIAQNTDIPSRPQVRATIRDGKLKSDAILFGSVRALYKTSPEITPDRYARKMLTKQKMVAEIQLSIENAKNGNIFWEDAIQVDENITTSRPMTDEEIQKYGAGITEIINRQFRDHIATNYLSYLKYAGIAIGIFLLLILLLIGIKAVISSNNVR